MRPNSSLINLSPGSRCGGGASWLWKDSELLAESRFLGLVRAGCSGARWVGGVCGAVRACPARTSCKRIRIVAPPKLYLFSKPGLPFSSQAQGRGTHRNMDLLRNMNVLQNACSQICFEQCFCTQKQVGTSSPYQVPCSQCGCGVRFGSMFHSNFE